MNHATIDFAGTNDARNDGAGTDDSHGAGTDDSHGAGTDDNDSDDAGNDHVRSDETENDDAGNDHVRSDDADESTSEVTASEREDAETEHPSRGDAGPHRTRRAVLGYALLFSVPVGVGVAVMMLKVTAGWPTDPLVFGPSLVVAAAVFLLLVAVGGGGSPES